MQFGGCYYQSPSVRDALMNILLSVRDALTLTLTQILLPVSNENVKDPHFLQGASSKIL